MEERHAIEAVLSQLTMTESSEAQQPQQLALLDELDELGIMMSKIKPLDSIVDAASLPSAMEYGGSVASAPRGSMDTVHAS